MLAVRVFGGLAVERDGAQCGGAAARRKTLALLALLAGAGRRGLSRDKLTAYLWPESDTEHGRGLLKQACYALRRDLGAPELFLGSIELRLNPGLISSDVESFEGALDQHDPARAVSLYRGPFLDGFYLNGEGDFGRWVEGERARLAKLMSDALQSLACAASERGEHRTAADWWRRLAELDPFSSRAALGLMTALEALGERAEALQHARLHGTLLHQELDAAPEAAVVELAERLRGESDGGPVRRWYSRRGGRRSSDGVAPEHAAVHDPAAPRSPRRGAGVTAAKLALGAALLTGIGAALVARPDRHVRLDPDLVAVAPFDVLPPQLALWREGLVDVLSRGLDRAGPLRAVTPTLVTREWRGRADPASAAELGRRTGAGLVLYGALLGAGPDSVQLTATLVDAASGRTLAELAYRDVVDRVDRMSDSVIAAVSRELRRTRPIVATAAGRRHRITTNVLGPDGSASICGLLPQGAQVPVRLFNSTPPPLLGGYGTLACPESRLHLSAPAGSWYLGVELPPAPGLGALPWRYLATSPVAIGGGDASHDIVIEEGSRLGGRATFEGKPVEGVGLTVSYESQGMMAAYGGSGKDGRWVEFFGRSPVVLQKGVRYTLRPFSCEFLGAKLVNKPPTGGFLFPSELAAIDCTLVRAPSARFTHDLTRLVVTAMPGDIGGLSDEFVHDLGFGWGVQFPVAAGQSPSHDPSVSQLSSGGLMIGIAPGRVLSGVTRRDLAACGAACRDLGLDGRVHVTASPQWGKRVTWRYSDARSPEGVGLRVVQQSFDGRPPADYVLFDFTITNAGPATTTFHAGFFGDWDIGVNDNDDVGFTEMGGRLMYQTDSDLRGPYLGTLLSGDAPITGNYFFTKAAWPSLTEQVDALAGRLSRPASDAPGDYRYIQGAGPITLGHEQSADLWIAVVAGDSREQLLANAAWAAADIANRRRRP